MLLVFVTAMPWYVIGITERCILDKIIMLICCLLMAIKICEGWILTSVAMWVANGVTLFMLDRHYHILEVSPIFYYCAFSFTSIFVTILFWDAEYDRRANYRKN